MDVIVFLDVLDIIILKYISESKDFYNLTQVSKFINSLCKKHTLIKMNQFSEGGILPNGKKHGEHIDCYFGGALEEKKNYFNGMKHGEYERWYPDGKMKISSFYVNGRREGKYKQWWHTGQLQEESHYVNGDKHGLSVSHYSFLRVTAMYDHGKIVWEKRESTLVP